MECPRVLITAQAATTPGNSAWKCPVWDGDKTAEETHVGGHPKRRLAWSVWCRGETNKFCFKKRQDWGNEVVYKGFYNKLLCAFRLISLVCEILLSFVTSGNLLPSDILHGKIGETIRFWWTYFLPLGWALNHQLGRGTSAWMMGIRRRKHPLHQSAQWNFDPPVLNNASKTPVSL